MMRMLPGMTVICPADYHQTKNATIAIAAHHGPVYLRFGRPAWPVFTDPNEPFVIGKAQVMTEGTDVTIVATGHLVWKAVQACEQLEAMGISAELINMHTIKPLDEKAVLKSVRKTRCVVTAEEHQCNGGLGDAISQVLSLHNPVPMEMVAVADSFGESGTPEQLLVKYGLDTPDIIAKVKAVIDRKNSK
jgi:transketolase